MFTPLDHEPIYKRVAERITESILAGDLPPGQALPPERELAEQLGVSRTSVREALRDLQARGLVASSGGRTSPLRPLGVEDATSPLSVAITNLIRLRRVALPDLVSLRCAIEAAALEAAAQRSSKTRLADARDALKIMSSEGVSVETFDEQDVRFHLCLVAASGNQAMHLVMLAIRDSIAEKLLDSLRVLPRPQETLVELTRQHEAIYDAVLSGDGSSAARLVTDHITNFYKGVMPKPRKTRG